MTQLAMQKRIDSQTQTSQTVCMVVDGNSHASNLLQDALPNHALLISEALVPQVRVVAMLLAASRIDFSQAISFTNLTDEADWFAARMLVLGVKRFYLDVSLLPMLKLANERAAAFAAEHQLEFSPASMHMSLHAKRAVNMLLMELDAIRLHADLGLVANSLAVKHQVSLQSFFCNLM